MTAGTEDLQFKAETLQLLNLLVRSRYTSKDIGYLLAFLNDLDRAEERKKLEEVRQQNAGVGRKTGHTVKKRLTADHDNRDGSHLLFNASSSSEKLISLVDCVGRVKPDQTEVCYLTGERWNIVDNWPALKPRMKEAMRFFTSPTSLTSY